MTITPQKIDLHRLAKEINERQQTIESVKDSTIEKANQAVAEAILQGQSLIKAKASIPHGQFENWLKAQCPLISYRTAARYMAIASKLPRVADLNQADSLRCAMALCDIEGHKKSEPREWPADLMGLSRLNKFVGFIIDHPLTTWPEASRDQLRMDMEPIAKELWPERFL